MRAQGMVTKDITVTTAGNVASVVNVDTQIVKMNTMHYWVAVYSQHLYDHVHSLSNFKLRAFS